MVPVLGWIKILILVIGFSVGLPSLEALHAADKGLIAFYSDRDGNSEIYTMKPDGTEVRRLTFNNAEDRCPSWSPDGKKIAFLSDRDGNKEIYIMDADGSNLQRLTFDPAQEYHADWSPDGNRIAFLSNRDGNDEIYVMNADGTNVKRLTYNAAEDMRPDWSPDGTRILFNSSRDGNREIYVMNADGTDQTRITHTSYDEIFPTWSPDGTRIAFFDFNNGKMGDIYVINSDGTGCTRLTTHPSVDEDPAWSPDGKKIAFQSSRDGNFEIYVMDADGSNQTCLTSITSQEFWADWSKRLTLLQSDKSEISASTGGIVQLGLEGGVDSGGCEYLLLGSVSGTGPGMFVPDGDLLALHYDPFMELVIKAMNTSCFSQFMDRLDASGTGSAQLNTMGPIDPGFAGLVMHFAYVVNTPPWGHVSNPVAIRIVP
jgi:TolB protein